MGYVIQIWKPQHDYVQPGHWADLGEPVQVEVSDATATFDNAVNRTHRGKRLRLIEVLMASDPEAS
jgi:hypothetical protein